MKSQTPVIVLAILNIALLATLSLDAQPGVLRGHTLELADAGGTVRSRIEVKPDGAVLLQLFDQDGVIKVKLGAGTGGSGLWLADETTDAGIQLIARGARTAEHPTTTSINFLGANGEQRAVFAP